VHRIGRTARGGATGTAISLCDANERDRLHDIERLIRQSIPAEDRRISASRLDNRPAHLHSFGQNTRGAAIHTGDAALASTAALTIQIQR
jgi:ATP-dependent RNA helicase RhlE